MRRIGKVGGEERRNVRAGALCLVITQAERGGREGRATLLGIGNPLRRSRNPVVDRGATSSEKGQRRGSIHRES